MGTRSGDMDPAILKFIMENDGISIDEMTNILNKKSGLLGLSERSSDMRDVQKGMREGDEKCALAFKCFVYRVRKYIGAYAAAMGGVDAVVFTAGIGENDAVIRQACVEGLDYMGIAIDPEKNSVRGGEHDISAEGAKVRTLVIATNEELTIALDTLELVNG